MPTDFESVQGALAKTDSGYMFSLWFVPSSVLELNAAGFLEMPTMKFRTNEPIALFRAAPATDEEAHENMREQARRDLEALQSLDMYMRAQNLGVVIDNDTLTFVHGTGDTLERLYLELAHRNLISAETLASMAQRR